eukprot:g31383.t1
MHSPKSRKSLFYLRRSEEATCYKTRKHQDWFNKNGYNIQVLINKKSKALIPWQNDITSESRGNLIKQQRPSYKEELGKSIAVLKKCNIDTKVGQTLIQKKLSW